MILIITDGENQDGDAIGAARDAADDGILIYTIGVGETDGEPIPLHTSRVRFTGYVQDTEGNMVFSRLDEDTLISVAEAGGGNFIRLSGSMNAASQFTQELAALEKASVGSEVEVTKIERFQIFAFRLRPAADSGRVDTGQATNSQTR